MSGNPHPVIQENRDGSININYKPVEQGIHELSLTYNDKQIEGTPFRCHVDKFGSGFITAYGPGLTSGSTGQTACFSIVGGGNDLSVKIDGPTRTDVSKQEKKDNHTNIEWIPALAGEYNVAITAKAKHIHGSPFNVKVSGGSGEGRKRSQLALTATSEVALGGKDVDLTNLVGIIKGPTGSTEDAIFRKLADGRLGLSAFSPKSKGVYQIDVTQEGTKLSGSPFKITVGDAQVATATHVSVTGDALTKPMANMINDLTLDVSKAGYGPLSMSIEGGHRSDITAKETDKGKYAVQIKPHEPGIYVLNIRFADDHVTGSPFMLSVGGSPSGRIRETATQDIRAGQEVTVGQQCDFQLKIPGTEPLDMEAFLTNPTGDTEAVDIMDLDDSMYDIRFKPMEKGIHTVSLKYKGLHISGSPFQYTVGPAPSLGPHKVEIGGPGLEQGEVQTKNEFNVYTREAGAGTLTVAVEGPSKATINIADSGKGFTIVNYTVTKEGDYGIHVKYDDVHVPNSPHKANITPHSSDAKKVTVHGLRDRGTEVSKPATFTLNLNGARGALKAYVDTPSGSEEEVLMQDMDEDLYALRFLPKENGVYYVHIKLNEAHVPGSPFAMIIGQAGVDPELIMAHGDGLEKGSSGAACKFAVVTTKVGAGVLKVNIDGPTKVAITCSDTDDGYEFSFTPKSAGDYLITIKFGNVNIAGCPFKAVITGGGTESTIIERSNIVVETVEKKPGSGTRKKKFTGDASKVVSKGAGLAKSFFNRESMFSVDVGKAGNGLLAIGMMNPKGLPVEQLNFKKQSTGRGTSFECKYKSSSKGEHLLSIRWGNDDVPGSPFVIFIQ